MKLTFDWSRLGEFGYCFHTILSGSWAGTPECQTINIRMNILPYEANNLTGFRFVKNK